MTRQKSNKAITWAFIAGYIGLVVGLLWYYENIVGYKEQEEKVKTEQMLKQENQQQEKQGKEDLEEEFSFVRARNQKLIAMNYQR